MKVTIVNGPDEIAAYGADVIETYVNTHDRPAIGLATGGTPLGIYSELIGRFRAGRVSFATTSAYLLDEYIGLQAGDPRTYANTITSDFVGHVDLAPRRLHGPDPNAPDLDTESSRYDRAVTNAAIGVQLLGLGRNGHVAFNEPGASPDSLTRVVQLSETTRRDNARFFGPNEKVPRRAITQGITTIMRAQRLLLVATGAGKANAVRATLCEPVTNAVPASLLRNHPKLTVVLDRAAAAGLRG